MSGDYVVGKRVPTIELYNNHLGKRKEEKPVNVVKSVWILQ
jgi:hypothetical protein